MKQFTFILLCTFLPAFLFAQTLFTNDGTTLTILNGTILTITGNLENKNNGFINNQGEIEISGDWTNNANNTCLTPNTGRLEFEGNNQRIGGTFSSHFNILGMTNATGPVFLDVNSFVETNLELGANNLFLNSNMLEINNPLSNAISNTSGNIIAETTSSAGYGTLRWNIGNNTANYVIPFGTNSGNDIPLDFDIQISGTETGAGGYLLATTYPTDVTQTPNNRPLPTGVNNSNTPLGVENAKNMLDRFWVIDAVNYSINPSGDLEFNYQDAEWNSSGGSTNTIIEANLRAQKWDSGTQLWSTTNQGNVSPVGNNVTINNFNDFGIWTLFDIFGPPLPITLLLFDAQLNQDKVDLFWKTSNEINSKEFIIEKTLYGIDFEFVTQKQAAGNSQEILNYQAQDLNPFIGKSYYRLKMIDLDGSFSYTELIPIYYEKNELEIVFYPNPNNGHEINIRLNSPTNEVLSLNIRDVLGRIIHAQSINYESHQNNIPILFQKPLAKGTYFATIKGEAFQTTEKLIIN